MSPLLIGIIIASVGLLLAVAGLVIRRKAARVLSVPLGKTVDVPRSTGAIGCEGTVRAMQPLAAPCTNTPCAYFEIVVEAKVKEKRGGQTQTKWKKLATRHQGSLFAIDDGSGPALVRAQETVEGDLEQTFSGPPPGGPGLGHLAHFVGQLPPTGPAEEILAYKVTERVIRVDGKLFALGMAQEGQLGRGDKPLLVSTRGRAAMVGSTKKKSLALLVAGTLVAGAGATVMVVRPGEAPRCGELVDAQQGCAVATGDVIEIEHPVAGGKTEKTKRRRNEIAWKVTKGGKFELAAHDPKKRDADPVIQVENSLGLPMNIDLGLAVGAGRFSTKTKTANLKPGDYKVYVFSRPDGPSSLVLEITPVAP